MFDSVESGIAAQERLLERGNAYWGPNETRSIRQVIASYSGDGDPTNPPGTEAAYVREVARMTGLDPNQQLPASYIPIIASAMRRHETNNHTIPLASA